MNNPSGRVFGLAGRGSAGLACDENGVTLGVVDLVRVRASMNAMGRRYCDVRPAREIRQVLQTAYGPQPDAVVLHLHQGLRRTAAWIEAGDLGRAGVEAVLLRLPDLTVAAMVRLAEFVQLEKRGAGGEAAWVNEPRIPQGQAGGGRWTTDGVAAPGEAAKPVQIASGGSSGGNEDNASPERPSPEWRVLPLDDGVYRPDVDHSVLLPAGGAEDDEALPFGSNGPPDDFTSLQEVFPGLRDAPALAIPLAPIDGFLGITASANTANLDATMMQYRYLIAQIRTVKPGFVDDELLPPGGIAGLSWQGRVNLLDDLRMERAAAFYTVRGEVGPLQVETLRFLQDAVDSAYANGVNEYNAGRLQPRLSREEAIGSYVDAMVRRDLREQFNNYQLNYGSSAGIRINNRDYDTSSNVNS
jgi:hypothetical protein